MYNHFFQLSKKKNPCLLDAETDTQLQLVNSGHVIATSGSDNPIVMVCNYLFDTVKQDAFRILGGRLQVFFFFPFCL